MATRRVSHSLGNLLTLAPPRGPPHHPRGAHGRRKDPHRRRPPRIARQDDEMTDLVETLQGSAGGGESQGGRRPRLRRYEPLLRPARQRSFAPHATLHLSFPEGRTYIILFPAAPVKTLGKDRSIRGQKSRVVTQLRWVTADRDCIAPRTEVSGPLERSDHALFRRAGGIARGDRTYCDGRRGGGGVRRGFRGV
jgi:hypothetical protein